MSFVTLDDANMTVPRGATFRWDVTWTAEAVEDDLGNWTATAVVDLTGYSAALQVRKFPDSDEVLLELTSEPDGGITLGTDGDYTTGKILIEFSPETTADLDFDTGHYDLRLESPAPADVTFLLSGRFGLGHTVTRLETS